MPETSEFERSVAWFMELADAIEQVEKIAAKGGAYRLAAHAGQVAKTLRVAKTLEQGKETADTAKLV